MLRACAMEYLHDDCEAPAVHCDLKPSNVLLDREMTAKVGDFGLARLLVEGGADQQSTSHVVKGSVGYITPGKRNTTIFLFMFTHALSS